MSISITPETKVNITITLESKPGASDTFGDHPEAFSEQSAGFGTPGLPITKETKNNISITNEAKN